MSKCGCLIPVLPPATSGAGANGRLGRHCSRQRTTSLHLRSRPPERGTSSPKPAVSASCASDCSCRSQSRRLQVGRRTSPQPYGRRRVRGRHRSPAPEHSLRGACPSLRHHDHTNKTGRLHLRIPPYPPRLKRCHRVGGSRIRSFQRVAIQPIFPFLPPRAVLDREKLMPQ